jgi:glucan 1,3-beta-glucosidase
MVYFPSGTYLVNKPIIAYYYTSLIGDAINPPTLKAAPSFAGIGVIDSDPYDDTGNNWSVECLPLKGRNLMICQVYKPE